MNRLIGIAVVGLVVAVTGTEGFARGGRGAGSGGGGQQRMGNASGASQYGYGGQMGAMQQQMIQNRYRMMQSQSGVGNGNLQQQARRMNGANAGQMAQGRQAMQGNLRSGGAGQSGTMQQQRLRDGSCGGQGSFGQTTGAGQMMQNRQRHGQSGNGNCPNR